MPRSVRRVPASVWLILVLHLLVALWQTAVFPNFRSPDEREHVDLVVQVAQGTAWPWPAPGTLDQSRGSAAGGFTSRNRIEGQLHLADQPIAARGERPSYRAAGGTDMTGQRPNQLIQHPPLYYLAGAAMLSLYPDWPDAPFDRVYLVLRLWTALLLAPVPLLLWGIARRLALPEPVPIAAALVPLAVPEFTRAASSVNNDSLFVLLAALVTFLVARVMTGDTSRRTAAAIGVLTSLALLSKGFALMMPAWIALAYVAATVRWRRPGAMGSLAIAGLLMLPGLGWWARNRLLYGTLQPNGYVTTQASDAPTPYGWSDGGLDWLTTLADRLITLFFVHDQTGQRQQHVPWWMAHVAFALIVVAVMVVLVARVLPRWDTVVLLTPTVGLAAIVAFGSWAAFMLDLRYGGMQGRYLHGGLVGLGVVAVAATARLPDRARHSVPLALFGFAGVIQGISLLYTLKLFWVPREGTGAGPLAQAVAAIYRWYALPPAVLAGVMAATAVAAVAVAVVLGRLAWRRPATAGVSGERSVPGPERRQPRAVGRFGQD